MLAIRRWQTIRTCPGRRRTTHIIRRMERRLPLRPIMLRLPRHMWLRRRPITPLPPLASPRVNRSQREPARRPPSHGRRQVTPIIPPRPTLLRLVMAQVGSATVTPAVAVLTRRIRLTALLGARRRIPATALDGATALARFT